MIDTIIHTLLGLAYLLVFFLGVATVSLIVISVGSYLSDFEWLVTASRKIDKWSDDLAKRLVPYMALIALLALAYFIGGGRPSWWRK